MSMIDDMESMEDWQKRMDDEAQKREVAEEKAEYKELGVTYKDRDPEAEEFKMGLDSVKESRFNSTGDDNVEVPSDSEEDEKKNAEEIMRASSSRGC
jgi:hypothetical protein